MFFYFFYKKFKLNSYCWAKTPKAHILIHLPQFMHLLLSTSGAENPRWLRAPVGHTLTAGQG
jgi:hypothetical protein